MENKILKIDALKAIQNILNSVCFISYHSLLHGLSTAILMIYTLRNLLVIRMIRRCKIMSWHA